jgi:non-heme chloroperoxidase
MAISKRSNIAMNGVLTTNIPLGVLGLALLAGAPACTHNSTSWHDPSHHRVQFVTVEDGVRLEVLDWGGSGRPVVLLAGSGLTAHVFDDLADKLSGPVHVYGITRRGFGVSSHPESGYAEQRLADDVLQVLDSLQLVKPVLAGHSMAGGELSTLGAQHSDRLAGLVYLDAARDPTRDYSELRNKLAASGAKAPSPSPADNKSFPAYRDWQMRTMGFAFPESELRNEFDSNPDGSIGRYRTASSVFDAIGAGVQKRNYAKIHVPVLAFFAIPSSAEENVSRKYQFKNAQERAAVEEVHAAVLNYIQMDERSIQSCVAGARVVELRRTDHYVFIASEAEVLRELRAFVAVLPRP